MLKSALLNKTTGKKVKPEDKFNKHAKFYSRIDGTEVKQMKIGNEWFFVALDYDTQKKEALEVIDEIIEDLSEKEEEKPEEKQPEEKEPEKKEEPKKEEVPPTHAKTPPPAPALPPQ